MKIQKKNKVREIFIFQVSFHPLRFAFCSTSLIFLFYFLFCLPAELFKVPYSSVVTDNSGRVLSARIASDGQWRFPSAGGVPDKFKKCLVAFEDKNFYSHPGVDLFAMARAMKQNVSRKKVVSGGSTITMQVIRLSRQNKGRTYWEKLIEMIWAGRLTLTYSKEEVLSLYATHAPFGSNIVGLEAASWRYFGRSPELLSWAESATLAVLPNAPSLIYPGKNQVRLLQKRNRLLEKLRAQNIIDEETLELSLSEPLPEKAFPIPHAAPHLLERAIALKGGGKRIETSLNNELQNRVTELVNLHSNYLRGNEIHNAAALVIEVNSGNILAYVGNSEKSRSGSEEHGNDVDVINAPRSTGSILKPFLYASMLSDGVILPNTLVPDIPTQIGGFTPQNFNLTYDGAVPAWRALARSLNIPCVRMMQQYGLDKFHSQLKKFGMSSFNRPASDYGMSLILGGGEGKLVEMAGAYAAMARSLKNFNSTKSYYENEYRLPVFIPSAKKAKIKTSHTVVNAAAIYLTFEAMAEVSRPDIEASWQRLGSGQKVAWKTGTSFGFRDGWAIGLNTDYVVAVWVGNADGEGRPGLTGISAAAPLLFRIFGVLPRTKSWFNPPLSDMKKIEVCKKSGHRAGINCNEKIMQWIPKNSENTSVCPYHRIIQVDLSGKFRLNGDCASPSEMQQVSWFMLPPAIEFYYKNQNPFYATPPPFKPGCEPSGRSMEMIYPRANAKIYVPVELSGNQGRTVFELAHRMPSSTVFWSLDGNYIGSTSQFHQMGLNPEKGEHVLTLTDEKGEMLTIPFEVVSEKMKNSNE